MKGKNRLAIRPSYTLKNIFIISQYSPITIWKCLLKGKSGFSLSGRTYFTPSAAAAKTEPIN